MFSSFSAATRVAGSGFTRDGAGPARLRSPAFSSWLAPLGTLLLLGCADGQPAPGPRADTGDGDEPVHLGDVSHPGTCGVTADSVLHRGLALLHHMTYEEADAAFAAAAETSPDCALAHWGQAMTRIHPLWSDPPSAAAFEEGAAHVATARSIGDASDRERAWVEAAGAYYDAGRQPIERPNLEAFAAAWERVHREFPDDDEAAAFHALSLLATAGPGDKTYAVQRRAAAVADSVLQRKPDHPGAHHYKIHALDYPELAEGAVTTAEAYEDIAPSIAHALHMPTHIFTRLGQWEETIALNTRSARAARHHPEGDAVSVHFHHALDYLAYGYLQRAEWKNAATVLDSLNVVRDSTTAALAAAYALAAIPARYALERGAWESAAALPIRVPEQYAWDAVPAAEAITHFARGIGAARSGDPAAARPAAERLAALARNAAETSDYWAQQIEVQRLAVQAWADLADGREGRALETMREAARLEASTEKHPVTPGEILPAQELLGEMLLSLDRYEAAEAAFATALERNPRRLRSLYGAGRAAEAAGDVEGAAAWYGELVELTAEGEGATETVRHAREFVERT